MNKYNLKFISDTDLFNHVKGTIQKYRFVIDLKKFNKNLIDPIKLTFDFKVYGKTINEIIESEIIRQIDKSNNNHIGYFHQNIFKYIVNIKTKESGWIVPKEGFDVINENKKFYIEMKNKHNTMNSKSSSSTYIFMLDKILKDNEATCMLVEIISKKSQNIKWQISLKKKPISHERIRRVSIDKFYELVTGDSMAFRSLVQILPKVIDDVLKSLDSNFFQSTVIKELENISTDILKSIYLLSFDKYNGFNSLDFS